jgi:diaminopropionate ammonia-lyase
MLPDGIPFPSTDAARPAALLARCPAASETPLVAAHDIARQAGVASVWVKDERTRMGLGSFKALGAAYVIACDAVAAAKGDDLANALKGVTYVTASAGNHGMSVAAGARVFGASAVIYIAETVPESFARRLRDKGARVVRAGREYEASMAAAANAAASEGWQLLSDSSWEGYTQMPHRLMEGYLALMGETARQVPEPPTHIFVQAGVGGLAGAVAAFARVTWGHALKIVVVEPDAAPALQASIRAGHSVVAPGPVSCMGRLDCKEPTITEAEAEAAMPTLAAAGLATTPSGGAGLAALLAAGPHRAALGLGPEARVFAILSEGPET